MTTPSSNSNGWVALAIALLMTTALPAQGKASKFDTTTGMTGATILSVTWPKKLCIACDKGFIEIDYTTGAVKIPEGSKMPDAARAFWEQTVKAFPEFKKAIIEGDKAALAHARRKEDGK